MAQLSPSLSFPFTDYPLSWTANKGEGTVTSQTATWQDSRSIVPWDEFGQNIKQAFCPELGQADFSNVTLACEDGHFIQAHKIVLSPGSLFFSDILLRTKHQHPFIYLKGKKKDKLKNIIDFIYAGESTVAKENLDEFLEVAQELKVKGLETKYEVLIDAWLKDQKSNILTDRDF